MRCCAAALALTLPPRSGLRRQQRLSRRFYGARGALWGVGLGARFVGGELAERCRADPRARARADALRSAPGVASPGRGAHSGPSLADVWNISCLTSLRAVAARVSCAAGCEKARRASWLCSAACGLRRRAVYLVRRHDRGRRGHRRRVAGTQSQSGLNTQETPPPTPPSATLTWPCLGQPRGARVFTAMNEKDQAPAGRA